MEERNGLWTMKGYQGTGCEACSAGGRDRSRDLESLCGGGRGWSGGEMQRLGGEEAAVETASTDIQSRWADSKPHGGDQVGFR